MASYIDATNTGSTISVNTVVYIQDGYMYNIDTDVLTTQPYGITLQEVTSGDTSFIPVDGEILLDTRTYNEGDVLYSTSAGTITNISPDTYYVYEVGIVLTSNILGKVLLTTAIGLDASNSNNTSETRDITTSQTILETDYTVNCLSALTLTLITAVGNKGKTFNIKSKTTGTIVIEPFGLELIDDDSDANIIVKNTTLTLQSNNTNWNII